MSAIAIAITAVSSAVGLVALGCIGLTWICNTIDDTTFTGEGHREGPMR